MNEKQTLLSFKTQKQGFDNEIQISSKAIIQLLQKTGNNQKQQEEWTLNNVQSRSEEIKKTYAEHIMETCTFDKPHIEIQKIIQEQPEEIEIKLQTIQNLFDKETNEINQKKANLKYKRPVPFETSKIKGTIPFDEIKSICNDKNEHLNYQNYLSLIGMDQNKQKELDECKEIQKKQTVSSKNSEEAILLLSCKQALEKKHAIQHQQIKNQILLNNHLKNIENNLLKIDLGAQIDELAQKFQRLPSMHNQENDNYSLGILAKNYFEYLNKVEQLKIKTNLLAEKQPRVFDFSDDFNALEDARKLCQEKLSEFITNKLNKLASSLGENPSTSEINNIKQQFELMMKNDAIQKLCENDENIKEASKQLQIKLNKGAKHSTENQESSTQQNNNPNSQVDHAAILKNVNVLLNSPDWAIKKRVTLFASKPTTVRKMLAIIKDTKSKGAEDTLSALKNYMKDRPVKRWLTNVHAQAFYTEFKKILNNLEEKHAELDNLKKIFQTQKM